ncbi:hypothetical protein M099_4019 [Phocaeicola vulgatus str. 3975 RP4]|uniref:Transposase n=1 Tax=Phocaeicola vulgatus str. 3975 RP4 TaxID=1339352 RepID=A0A069S3S2_PHOVU|nr:hypothetical protein M099_4019 [Phocaeicola vulgatus str. 3975 RP4]
MKKKWKITHNINKIIHKRIEKIDVIMKTITALHTGSFHTFFIFSIILGYQS